MPIKTAEVTAAIMREKNMGKLQKETSIRIRTGIVIAFVVGGILLFSHIPFILYTATALLCVGSIWELHHVVRNQVDGITVLVLAGAMAVTCFPVENYQKIITLVYPISFLLFGCLMHRIGKEDTIYTGTFLCISAVLVSFFAAIPEIRGFENGFYFLITTVLVGAATDISAYFIGRRLGKHKLAPKISPGKTIEGAVGGTLMALGVLLLITFVCEKAELFFVDYPRFAEYLVVASFVGQFGDLAMSCVKRIVGVKDYGNFLPGHGGLLDRFDSLLYIAPFTYLFCTYFGPFYL